MPSNVLVFCGDGGAAELVASLAARSGEDVGLVDTRQQPGEEWTSGGRIEQEREYGGVPVWAFDDAIAVGSAVAQLAGHADSVIVDRLDDWANHLHQQLGDDEEALESEITSMASVLRAQLADLLLVTRPLESVDGPGRAVFEQVLETLRPLCDTIVDASSGELQVLEGELPE